MDEVQLAVENFAKKKYNCTQAVVCAFCEDFGLSEVDGFRVAEAFGGGMGKMGGVCGAVTGAYIIMGLANCAADLQNPTKSKMETYADVRELTKKFEDMNTSVLCRELKCEKPLRSCPGCVEDAAKLLVEYLEMRKQRQ